ncbi:fumarate reductase subunit FrdD [Cellulomonas denverensis]|uniref:Fumarate reductase subunit D n=1 Tax=Cellulomonas denverensis TaxID=264297 RepID=A0A7X6KTV7_9CELL|nr:fumarate reductase subunit FrdD [Cellulomonas denverensis]NKY22053.1 fumarate reductase subunit D [Cellulomonas denverensis]GIG27208.1 fumarate reductase subunit D [Cellulomonas denverensis]
MRRWEGRTNEPLMWALFGGGGMLAVFTMPVLIVVFGFLVPFGVFGSTDEVYDRVQGFLTHPLVTAGVCVALGLVLWHCCHRTYHALHDLGLHPPEIVRAAIYGVALLTPVVGFALCLAA